MMKFVGMFLMNLSTTRIPACKALGLFWLPVLLWAGSVSPLRAAWGSHAVLPPMSGDSLSVAQDACLVELDRLFARIYACDDSQRRVVSDSFCRAAKQVLAQYAGLDFPFERIRNLSYFKAADGRFRILNWGIPDQADGTVSYKALLQVRNDETQGHILYDMSDMSLYQPYPEQTVCTPETWWGAYYYACIEKQDKGTTYYTFLGWNAGQGLYQQSVIEVMTITPDGQVRFGAPVFSNHGRVPGLDGSGLSIPDEDRQRVVFRFGKRTGMILRYDYQTYLVKTGRKKAVQKKDNMIIFDKLMPQQMAMADDYAYYIPQGGVYQAYVWLDGCWDLQLDVQARNPEKPRANRKRENPPPLFVPSL